MARIAIIGDLHIGARQGNKEFLEFQTAWLFEFTNKAKELGVEAVIQAGDFHDIRKHTPNNVLHWHEEQFEGFVNELGVPWHILVGNHDIFYRDSNEIYSTQLLKRINPKLIHTYNRFTDVVIAGEHFLMIPWLDELNREEFANVMANSTAKYAIGHLEIAGSSMYRGISNDHGMSAGLFDQFSTVFTGHYHTISNQRSVQYVGAPYHLTWADYADGTDRGWWLFDTDTGRYELIRNEEHMTLFSVIEYDEDVTYTEEMLAPYAGNIIKVIVNKKDNANRFKKFLDIFRSIKVIDYSIIDNTVITVTNNTVNFNEGFAPSTLDVISGYINEQETDLDKNKLIQTATQIFTEASTRVQ